MVSCPLTFFHHRSGTDGLCFRALSAPFAVRRRNGGGENVHGRGKCGKRNGIPCSQSRSSDIVSICDIVSNAVSVQIRTLCVCVCGVRCKSIGGPLVPYLTVFGSSTSRKVNTQSFYLLYASWPTGRTHLRRSFSCLKKDWSRFFFFFFVVFQLYSITEMKPPISKAKMTAITRNAIKAIKLYKHVVQCVEKFIHKVSFDYAYECL